ncbi:MAG: glycosyltransferase [Promethearchaeota archaeon]
MHFNRMPYHQSYDFKDLSCFLAADTIALHLNRCKGIGRKIVQSWASNKPPVIVAEENTRSGIIVPMQNSSVAERALMKNLYSLAASNKANIYRDEDVGFPIVRQVRALDKIRDAMKGERPAFDRGLFFMINNFLFMIDHGEKIGKRAAWIIGKYVNPRQLAGIFIEQMDEGLDVSASKIPIIPLTYGTKQPLLWHNQGLYHDLSINGPKKYSIHFIGNYTTSKNRQRQAEIITQIPNSRIEHRGNRKRLTFDEYMRDMAMAHIVWCPPGGRPKTHREIEAMCCEIAVLMPKQHIVEQEILTPDIHYICVRDDHSDVRNKVQHYLSNPEQLAEIAYGGRMWYERNASDNARAKYILENALKIIARIK